MSRRVIVGLGVLVLASSPVLVGAGFWETKPFMTWSAKEVQEVLADSPWSRTVSVVLNAVGRGSNLAGDEGLRGMANSGGGSAVRSGAGREERAASVTAPPQLKLLISWRSALPMKQALVREQVGAGGTVPAESRLMLDRSEPSYVITMVGLPLAFARAADGLKAETSLRRGGKPPIAATDAVVQQAPAALVLLFLFPKTDPIALDDKEIEFVTRLGDVEIKRKFNLKDMAVRGQLEL